jgi:hypothetical protein
MKNLKNQNNKHCKPIKKTIKDCKFKQLHYFIKWYLK